MKFSQSTHLLVYLSLESLRFSWNPLPPPGRWRGFYWALGDFKFSPAPMRLSQFPQQETKIKAEFTIEISHLLSSHDFFQLSRTTKSKKISLCNEAVLFVDDSTNTFDVSSDI